MNVHVLNKANCVKVIGLWAIHECTFHPSYATLLDSKLSLSALAVPAAVCPLISFPVINNSLVGF